MPGNSGSSAGTGGAVGGDRRVKLVEQRRAGNLHLDRVGERDVGKLGHVARAHRERRVVAGEARIKELRGVEAREIALVAFGRRSGSQIAQQRAGVERQQHRHRADPDAREALRHDGVEPVQDDGGRAHLAGAGRTQRHSAEVATAAQSTSADGRRGAFIAPAAPPPPLASAAKSPESAHASRSVLMERGAVPNRRKIAEKSEFCASAAGAQLNRI